MFSLPARRIGGSANGADRGAHMSFSETVNSKARYNALRYAWMKANYLIAAGIAMAGWLFLIAWMVSRIV